MTTASAGPGAVAPPQRLADTDWLHHRLEVSGPAGTVTAFAAASRGAGVIPWQLDLAQIEEDLFHRLIAPPPPQRRSLSLVGARALARQLCEATAVRQAAAVARVGLSQACPLDLYALIPVPPEILRLGPDDPEALAWLWAHWGTTDALRHVALEPAPALRVPLPAQTATVRYSFWSADWTLASLGGAGRALADAALPRPPDLRPAVTVSADAMPSQLPGDAEDAAWEDPPRRVPAVTAPVLAVEGFEGPLDWLLELVRSHKLDLKQLSILALIEAFASAMEAALTPGASSLELARWAAWTVMAAQLAELRSRLLLPAEVPEAQAAQAQAEALRRHWISRAEMQAAVDWLEQQPQLGRDVFARGRAEPAWVTLGLGDGRRLQAEAVADDDAEEGATIGSDNLTELLRACLVALRLPTSTEIYQPRQLPFWSVSDARQRITQLLPKLPHGGALEVFLPGGVEPGPGRSVHRRAALAATLVAGLELARGGALTLEQQTNWQSILVV